jgi:translation initiation factor 5B
MDDKMMLRSPICSVLGHVDHGKSSILDAIRGSAIVKGEAGAITQAIGASIIPIETINAVAGELLGSMRAKIDIPGLLFIDTPGHAAFTSLRKRGGTLADIAIVVCDINEGPKPQTIEAIEILRQYKTPFIIAANKIDLVQGYRPNNEKSFMKNMAGQDAHYNESVEIKLYELVGKFQELGFMSERFDRISDHTKEISIVPVSAKGMIGIPELLMVLIGLAQKYLRKDLHIDPNSPAKGIILEVKEDKGLGTTLDVIIYDGTIRIHDTIVTPTLDGTITTKVRALLEPAALHEMRDKKAEFMHVTRAIGATGVKICAHGLEGAIAGMPLVAAIGDDEALETIKEELASEISDTMIETENEGVIIKADTLGSLEAVSTLLKEKDIPIKKASIGPISLKDVKQALALKEDYPEYGTVLGFNVGCSEEIVREARKSGIRIISHDVIYRIMDDYEAFREETRREEQRVNLKGLPSPCRIMMLPGYVFRQSGPAIVGCVVEKGELRVGVHLMKKGKRIGRVKSMQKDKETVSKAEEGDRVAVSIEGATVGRQIDENDVLYSLIEEEEFRTYKKHKDILQPSEKEVLTQIGQIMREENAMWGV